MKKEIYVFSGLGADERVFQLLEFPGYAVTFVQWIPPQTKETIQQYAARLLAQISSPKPILIGLSFGGLMAVEVAKQLDIEKVILIASVKTRNELPPYYRLIGKLRLHQIVPAGLLKRSTWITDWFFGAASTFDKAMLKQILKDTDPGFLKWAIDQVLNWTNQDKPQQFVHIHGSADRILPLRFVHYDYNVQGGGHLMTLNKAEELNLLLQAQLQTH
ncbi:MAG TPA: alpha/beta hydrolase [Chitinophagaceae bacterium]|nr:alpha/beta hydrolase [Chitinophagaceae bacterium]